MKTGLFFLQPSLMHLKIHTNIGLSGGKCSSRAGLISLQIQIANTKTKILMPNLTNTKLQRAEIQIPMSGVHLHLQQQQQAGGLPPVYWRSQLWTQSILQTPFGKCKITNYKYKIPIQKYTCQKNKFKQLFIEGPMLRPSLFSKIYKTPKFQTMYFVHNIKHRIKKYKNANTKRKRNNILKYKFKQANFEPNYFELVHPIASVRQKHVTLFAPLRH